MNTLSIIPSLLIVLVAYHIWHTSQTRKQLIKKWTLLLKQRESALRVALDRIGEQGTVAYEQGYDAVMQAKNILWWLAW